MTNKFKDHQTGKSLHDLKCILAEHQIDFWTNTINAPQYKTQADALARIKELKQQTCLCATMKMSGSNGYFVKFISTDMYDHVYATSNVVKLNRCLFV